MLLPLTESLYVSGTLETIDSVLLEVGTGYYVEVRHRSGHQTLPVLRRALGGQTLACFSHLTA